ncbi:MAG TPA: hypothetical protein VMA54_04385, partial [Steroidobacteraceae bacterium]|nr:hypothetical protein [Steroidobacteraceae bacterium]
LREVCDIAIVPALRLLEADFARGSLKPARRRAILDQIQQWVDELLEGLQRTDGRGLSWQSPSILCLPAEDQADAIIAKLLTAVLINRGSSARVVSLEQLDEEIASSGEELRAVVISALPPEAVPPARAAVKRIRARVPDLPVIVGLWGLDHDLDRAGQRLGSVGVSLFETRVGNCVERIEKLRQAPEPGGAQAPPELVHGS